MTDETFEKVIENISLPLGELLSDNKTYRLSDNDFSLLKKDIAKKLSNFKKMLVLTDGNGTTVGGILFYGSADIQIHTLPKYRGNHYMSNVFKNGIVKNELYPKQKVTLATNGIESFEDFCMKHYLVSCVGLVISNLEKIYDTFHLFEFDEEFKAFSQFSKEKFLVKFSQIPKRGTAV